MAILRKEVAAFCFLQPSSSYPSSISNLPITFTAKLLTKSSLKPSLTSGHCVRLAKTPKGLEPLQAEPNGFLGHSDTVSCCQWPERTSTNLKFRQDALKKGLNSRPVEASDYSIEQQAHSWVEFLLLKLNAKWQLWGSNPRPYRMAPWATALDRSAKLSWLSRPQLALSAKVPPSGLTQGTN